jgi:hypothetical protein
MAPQLSQSFDGILRKLISPLTYDVHGEDDLSDSSAFGGVRGCLDDLVVDVTQKAEFGWVHVDVVFELSDALSDYLLQLAEYILDICDVLVKQHFALLMGTVGTTFTEVVMSLL